MHYVGYIARQMGSGYTCCDREAYEGGTYGLIVIAVS